MAFDLPDREYPTARRAGQQVLVGDGVTLALSDAGDGKLGLSAPECATSETSVAAALAAFEVLSAQGGEVAIRLDGEGWAILLPQLVAMGVAWRTADAVWVLPVAFWQVPDRWIMHQTPPWPTVWQSGRHGRHPVRPPKPVGPLYRRHIPWLGQQIELRAADIADLPVFHRWQNDPRVAVFFEGTGTLDDHRNTLKTLISDPHILPVIGSLDGRDFGYFELYWARENRIGGVYDADPWDRGWHVLIGEDDMRGADYVTAWMPSLMHYMFLVEPRTQALVGEPKASHLKQLKNLGRGGFAHVRDFDFAHKRATLVRLERQHFFESRLWARPDTGQGTPLALSLTNLLLTGEQ
ncbi:MULTISPECIES: GNAT family N-acetyltransferase [Roseobacteraceae]|uniref:N(6)-hydroxylysine O-acetyltransferase n=1 Tax=Pseudosulfitobacter pseudonitzschiae TaxID=1402135 RepID=A0A221JWK6_9RHOB|nr:MULTISPECIES: GNAT family N-acetyltransferase [Roseobacteraceae]ASM71010.1 N(6)-hydroxylysine O-acetyltransferase [Pseudosulfitobacter pseudonitzschiae]